MFPQLTERAGRVARIAKTHAILARCNNWQDYGFIRFWSNRNLGIASDIETLMEKYECVRDGVSVDGEMAKFIRENREIMDEAFVAWDT